MLFNYVMGLYCFYCRKYYSPYTEVYLPDGSENEGRVSCLKCDNVLGYTHDLSWRKFWESDITEEEN